jgi:hypothetical protein
LILVDIGLLAELLMILLVECMFKARLDTRTPSR